ncbi:MAG: hypothetical protein NVS4B8_17530 [Herpetosiphon sp.]
MEETAGPLAGCRVLELGNLIAVPYCGRLFAKFGAEVIKVERPRGGDELRQWRLTRGTTSMMWYLQARNKTGQTRWLGPELGAHTADVYGGLLGYVQNVLLRCDRGR